MAQMNISNTLWNDTSSGEIAYSEQLKDKAIRWNTVDPNQAPEGQTPKYKLPSEFLNLDFRGNAQFQTLLNEFFLSHYVEFHNFLEEKGVDGVIDTWKDVEEFLDSISDDQAITLLSLIRDSQLLNGYIKIEMSSTVPGLIQAISNVDTPSISNSFIDDETGIIRLIYNIE